MSDNKARDELEREIEGVLWELFDHPMHRRKKTKELLPLIDAYAESRERKAVLKERIDQLNWTAKNCMRATCMEDAINLKKYYEEELASLTDNQERRN